MQSSVGHLRVGCRNWPLASTAFHIPRTMPRLSHQMQTCLGDATGCMWNLAGALRQGLRMSAGRWVPGWSTIVPMYCGSPHMPPGLRNIARLGGVSLSLRRRSISVAVRQRSLIGVGLPGYKRVVVLRRIFVRLMALLALCTLHAVMPRWKH